MFSSRLRKVTSRLENFSNLRKIPVSDDIGFFRKIKYLYSNILFLFLRPLVNRQNAYNKAVYDFNMEVLSNLDEVSRKIIDIRDKVDDIEDRLKKLEYKVWIDFPSNFDYSKFEDQFRGPEELIKERQKIYLDYINKQKSVLDIGCGRGEFLELLKENGIKAFGIDSNRQMVKRCLDKGLEVEYAHAISYLKNYQGSLGNIFLSMIVEHLDFKDIFTIINTAWEKMEKDSVILIETINPNSFYAQSRAYVIDPTHINLVSPETLSYTFQKVGFRNLKIIYKSPVPKEQRLKFIKHQINDKELNKVLRKINTNLEILDDIIFGNLEYVIMGVK
jgi:O-antigen chain-terminating methyltransferase